MGTTDGTDALLLVLRRQQARYAVPAENVEEVLSIPDVTALPRQPEYMRGIFSYKGRAAAVLSLQTLCGCGTGESETVCVVLRIGDFLIALTADGAESLIADSGQRMQADGSLLDGKLLSLDFVLPGDPAVFVLNLKKTYQKIESDFSAASFV